MTHSDDQILTGFPPIADSDVDTLILGSMPSARSLQMQQYYGHPRNAFWPIMSALLGGQSQASYQQRQDMLLAHHIAVWDVIKDCRREGSLDSRIDEQSMVVNDFNNFFYRHPKISAVFFNGNLAEKVYKKYILPGLSLPKQQLAYQRLPSTSPAHAALSLQAKTEVWRTVLTHRC